MNTELTIEERLDKMRRMKAAFDDNWQRTTEAEPPVMMCSSHNVNRSVDVKKSLILSWYWREYRVVFKKCYKCVGEDIEARRR